jgi:LmbE family N-acetylglucosaminyl deacetylase
MTAMKAISRRSLLGQAGLLGGTAAVALPLLAASGPESAAVSRKLKVVVTGGHPGDPECGCGGTIARYTEGGHDVVLIYLNRGEPEAPTHLGITGVRVAEAQRARELLKARPVFAHQIDGHAIVDPDHYAEFRELLERERPDVVFTHWPI